MIIIAFLFYEIMLWFKKTRAWALLKGIIIVLAIVLLAAILQLNTILWLASKTINVGIIGIIIIFQPELRRALEQLGRGKLFRNIFGSYRNKQRIQVFVFGIQYPETGTQKERAPCDPETGDQQQTPGGAKELSRC